MISLFKKNTKNSSTNIDVTAKGIIVLGIIAVLSIGAGTFMLYKTIANQQVQETEDLNTYYLTTLSNRISNDTEQVLNISENIAYRWSSASNGSAGIANQHNKMSDYLTNESYIKAIEYSNSKGDIIDVISDDPAYLKDIGTNIYEISKELSVNLKDGENFLKKSVSGQMISTSKIHKNFMLSAYPVKVGFTNAGFAIIKFSLDEIIQKHKSDIIPANYSVYVTQNGKLVYGDKMQFANIKGSLVNTNKANTHNSLIYKTSFDNTSETQWSVILTQNNASYVPPQSMSPLFILLGGLSLIVLLLVVFKSWWLSSKQSTQLREYSAQLVATLKAIPDQIFEIDESGTFISLPSQNSDLVKYHPQDLLGKNITSILPSPADMIMMEAIKEAKEEGLSFGHQITVKVNNENVWYELSVSIKEPTTSQKKQKDTFIVLAHDITVKKATSDKAHNLAYYDPLTQLPNRRLLIDKLKTSIAQCNYGDISGAVIFMDLDNFKTINDTQGHEAGDILLRMVADRLKEKLRETDVISRLGGDEFVIILNNLSGNDTIAISQAKTISDSLWAYLNQPYTINGKEYTSTPSMGISIFNNHDFIVDDILKHADIAMYESKSLGKNSISFFNSSMQESINSRVQIENELKNAIVNQEFELYYQKQISNTKQILGAEVLIRWNHPLKGLVYPTTFIPISEECGLIIPIGYWALETACKQLARWKNSVATQNLYIAVNISAHQFRLPDFVETITSLVTKYNFRADLLKLELTESVIVDDMTETIQKMNELKKTGIQFSMDDFGTGYSSLSYLTNLPFNQLKIDQSFVSRLDVTKNNSVIIQTIIGMANNLNMNIVAEGVETEKQEDFLLKNGCHAMQGYLYGRPVPLHIFENDIKNKVIYTKI